MPSECTEFLGLGQPLPFLLLEGPQPRGLAPGRFAQGGAAGDLPAMAPALALHRGSAGEAALDQNLPSAPASPVCYPSNDLALPISHLLFLQLVFRIQSTVLTLESGIEV